MPYYGSGIFDPIVLRLIIAVTYCSENIDEKIVYIMIIIIIASF